jgi:hypothetical protein
MWRPQKKTAAGAMDVLAPIIAGLGRVRLTDMPKIERAAVLEVYRAIANAGPSIKATDLVYTFMAAITSATSSVKDQAPSGAKTYRAEFIKFAPRFASVAGLQELTLRMVPAIEDQLRTQPTLAEKAAACTAWMLTAIASGDGRGPTITTLVASAQAAVRAAVPTREETLGH